jgi:hypothetical protein
MLEAEAVAVQADVAATASALWAQELEVRALGDEPSLAGLRARQAEELAAAETAQAARRRRGVEIGETVRAAREELWRIRAGDWGDPRAHLRQPHHPIPPEETRYGRIVELWSAVSAGLLLLAIVLLVYFGILSPIATVLVVIAAYMLIESAFQRRLTLVLLRVTLLLAILGAIVLVVTYATELLVLAVVGLAALVLIDNIRELRGA